MSAPADEPYTYEDWLVDARAEVLATGRVVIETPDLRVEVTWHDQPEH